MNTALQGNLERSRIDCAARAASATKDVGSEGAGSISGSHDGWCLTGITGYVCLHKSLLYKHIMKAGSSL
jgi:hypothetical protein